MILPDTFTIVIVCLVALSIIIFLAWKNQKDKKKINPQADGAVEEVMTDQHRRKDKN